MSDKDDVGKKVKDSRSIWLTILNTESEKPVRYLNIIAQRTDSGEYFDSGVTTPDGRIRIDGIHDNETILLLEESTSYKNLRENADTPPIDNNNGKYPLTAVKDRNHFTLYVDSSEEKAKVDTVPEDIRFHVIDGHTGKSVPKGNISLEVPEMKFKKTVQLEDGWAITPSRDRIDNNVLYTVESKDYRLEKRGLFHLSSQASPVIIPMKKTNYQMFVESSMTRNISLALFCVGATGWLFYSDKTDDAYSSNNSLGYASGQFDSAWDDVESNQMLRNFSASLTTASLSWIVYTLGYSKLW